MIPCLLSTEGPNDPASFMTRIALIGCGQIADAHLQEIRKIAGAQVVAVCDRHQDLASQAALRFGVARVFDDLSQMLAASCPDVVHITTPPQTHRRLALEVLRAGSHVYVEKPFALDRAEAQEMLDAARAAGRLACVGHDQLYDPVWLECRRLIDAGTLGRIVHVESSQGYDLNGPFGRSLVADPAHWVRHLPGGLFQNVMSHALYRITDLMPDSNPQLWATWFGEAAAAGLPTELRVQMRGAETTASLVFSSAARPVQRTTRIYGTRSGIEVDPDTGLIRQMSKVALPGALGKLEAPIRQWTAASRASVKNLGRFLRSDIHYFAGMKNLFEAFYQAIATGQPAPISPAETLRVTAWMDEIFTALPLGTAGSEPIHGRRARREGAGDRRLGFSRTTTREPAPGTGDRCALPGPQPIESGRPAGRGQTRLGPVGDSLRSAWRPPARPG